VFGQALHKAMEVFYWPSPPCFDEERVNQAIAAFLAHFQTEYSLDCEEYAPKTASNGIRLIRRYAETYKELDPSEYQTEAIEIGGNVFLDSEGKHSLWFTIDMILWQMSNSQYMIFDHKTTKGSFTQSWMDGWKNKFQLYTYNHVLHCLHSPELVKGIIINGLCVNDPPKRTKAGQPYANARDICFMRQWIYHPPERMEAWRQTAIYWCERFDADIDQLDTPSARSDTWLKAFPHNFEACTHYFGCPYLGLCQQWTNPLHHVDEVPFGFTKYEWEPDKKAREAQTQFDALSTKQEEGNQEDGQQARTPDSID